MVAIRRNGCDAQSNALWECKCDCGNVVLVRGAFLKKGQRFCAKQCRLHRKHAMSDIAGKRFGRLVAEKFLRMHPTKGNAVWRFRCDCGNVRQDMVGKSLQAPVCGS